MTTSERDGTIRYETSDGTATITIDRPRKLNAFHTDLYGEFKQAVLQASRDDIDLLVVTGAGRAFSTGGDLAEVRELVDSGQGLQAFFDKLPFKELLDVPATTVASVRGPCLAGGIEIALCCDFILASESATFGFSQALIGLADTTAPYLLFGRVSLAQLRRLLFTGVTITADEAARIGLVDEVVPDGDLESATARLAGELRQVPGSVRREYKAIVHGLLDMPSHRSIPVPETLDLLRGFLARSAARTRNAAAGDDEHARSQLGAD